MGMLQDSLQLQSDVILLFDDGDLPGHTLILQLWSGVMGEALKTCQSTKESGSVIIPMPGTMSSDWLKVAAFMYPSEAEAATVSWDNLEALLVLSDKYDMPAIAVKGAIFLDAHSSELGHWEDDPKNIWKWLPLLDKAVLCCNLSKHLLENCIFRAVSKFRQTCSAENLGSLSPSSVILLATAMAGTHQPIKRQ